MLTPSRSHQERPNTYIVQDPSYQEIQRLQFQEQMMTLALGGVLPEQIEPMYFRSVLDVACGTGGWLIELAQIYPTISRLVGVDINRCIIDAAAAEAEARQVQDRVKFRVMDALSRFEWSDNSFDLANLRFASSFLRTWEWPHVLRELRRVARPGGIIRLTESDLPEQSSSPALLHLFRILIQAYAIAGKSFRPLANGVTEELAGLLEQQEIQNVQTCVYRPEVHAGTTRGQLFVEDMKYLFRTHLPFLQKWTRVPDDYEALYEQMLRELEQPDFVVTSQVITAWGMKA
jgi:ubiquinone/menaquinone biosynthesis C-methylase UbiE